MLDIELGKPDLILIEEPEIHLHPALETAVMRYLKRSSETSQIFLTTHSTNFIDSGEYSAIHFVRKTHSTVSLALSFEQAADALPRELGLRLSSLFMYEKLVFVEGPSDEDVLREWASTLSLNLSKANVGFINIGGSRNIKHFSAARTTDFLLKRGVETWFILDRDENGTADVAKLKAELGPERNVRVLSAREIENFLAMPVALSKHIRKRLARSGTGNVVEDGPSCDEVKRRIDECAEGLRNLALGKALSRRFIAPIHLRRPKLDSSKSIGDIIDDIKTSILEGSSVLESRTAELDGAAAEFGARWDAEWAAHKLAIVPGTELLEAVFRHYNLAYAKQRDAREIAALMTPSEIPPEVCKILREIAFVQ